MSTPNAATVEGMIRDELAVGDDSYFLSHEAMRAAIGAVLDLHHPFTVYYDCGHNHDETGGTDLTERLDRTTVCKEARTRVVCVLCCCWEFGVSDDCESNHGHETCYPCKTVRVIGEQLDLIKRSTDV